MTTIYIADDESAIRTMFTRFLERDGYDVKAFPDVYSLGAAMQKAPPDLAIIDGTLGRHRDGYEYAVAIRTTQRTPVIKVILCAAGDANTDYVELCGRYGLTYVAKPASLPDLRIAIANELRTDYL